MKRTLIHNATIVNEGQSVQGSVVIENGRIAACMGSCTEYAADSFRAGRVAATALYRRLHCISGIGGVGVSDAAVYKDVRKAVSSLPAGNGQHDLPPGYGNRTSGGSGNGLPPGRCVPALPRRRCSRHTCLVLLRPADVSLL